MTIKKIDNQDVMRVAMRRIRIWQDKPSEPVSCPMCDAPGLKVEDRSTRPYAEWFIVECPTCGLEDTIQVPSASRSP